MKALWQSLDYALLSTPTRPGSPTPGAPTSSAEFFTSPSQLFDFADFGMFVEGVDAFGSLPLFENNMALAGEDLEHHTTLDIAPAS